MKNKKSKLTQQQMMILEQLEVDTNNASHKFMYTANNRYNNLNVYNSDDLTETILKYCTSESVKSYDFNYTFTSSVHCNSYFCGIYLTRTDDSVLKLNIKDNNLVDALFRSLVSIINFLSSTGE